MSRSSLLFLLPLAPVVWAQSSPLDRDPSHYIVLGLRQANIKNFTVAAPGCHVGVNSPNLEEPSRRDRGGARRGRRRDGVRCLAHRRGDERSRVRSRSHVHLTRGNQRLQLVRQLTAAALNAAAGGAAFVNQAACDALCADPSATAEALGSCITDLATFNASGDNVPAPWDPPGAADTWPCGHATSTACTILTPGSCVMP